MEVIYHRELVKLYDRLLELSKIYNVGVDVKEELTILLESYEIKNKIKILKRKINNDKTRSL